MAKLSNSDMKKAAKMARLLDEHVAVTDAIRRLKLKRFEFSLSVNDESNDSNFLTINLHRGVAEVALNKQRKRIVSDLGKLGITVGA